MKRILWMAASALIFSASSQADMRWKTEMKIDSSMMGGKPGAGMPAGMTPGISYTTAVTNGAQRKESQISMGPFSNNDVIITLCDKKQRLQIDDDLKIYTTSELTNDEGGFVNPMAGMAGMLGKMLPPGMKIPGMPSAPQGAPATGKIVSTITAENLGDDTVAETPTKHWMLTIKNEKSGCAGTGEDTMKIEVWSANFDEPMFCPDAAAANPVRDFQKATRPDSNCKITFEMKGDGFETFSKIFGGLVMRLKLYDPKTGKPAMTQEVTMVTRAKQEGNLFQVPEGYQKVTADEFQQKKGQAMMQKLFKGGLPGLGG